MTRSLRHRDTRRDASANLGEYITPNNFYRAVWNNALAEVGIKG